MGIFLLAGAMPEKQEVTDFGVDGPAPAQKTRCVTGMSQTMEFHFHVNLGHPPLPAFIMAPSSRQQKRLQQYLTIVKSAEQFTGPSFPQTKSTAKGRRVQCAACS